MNVRPNMPSDPMSDALAAFVEAAPAVDAPASVQAAKFVLLDTFAVALGAVRHPAAVAAHRYARLFPASDGALIWGTSLRAAPETAALVNGVPLRAYDYNDLYIGRRNGGHPSDMVPGVLAVGEWRGSSGRDVIGALCLGYEVVLNLFDAVSSAKAGWDYVNLTAIGATCAIAKLLELNRDQTAAALAITVVPHAASNEIESGDLNSRGDLTMWKRFNGGDAVRQAVYACLLASVGVEGAVRPFVGACGFLTKVNAAEDALAELLRLLVPGAALTRIGQTTFKRWPVGSRAQSAIQAALQARQGVKDIAAIRQIKVVTQDAVYDHLVRRRDDPWRPVSRETADHSLPYIVAAAVLDGHIDTDSFDPAKVLQPARQRFLMERVEVETAAELNAASPGEWLSRVEITSQDGSVLVGQAMPPPGHPKRPFSEQDLIEKLHVNADAVLGTEGTNRLIREIERLPEVAGIASMMSCLSGRDSLSV